MSTADRQRRTAVWVKTWLPIIIDAMDNHTRLPFRDGREHGCSKTYAKQLLYTMRSHPALRDIPLHVGWLYRMRIGCWRLSVRLTDRHGSVLCKFSVRNRWINSPVREYKQQYPDGTQVWGLTETGQELATRTEELLRSIGEAAWTWVPER